jgi:hypothetical protein
MKTRRLSVRGYPYGVAAIGSVLMCLLSTPAQCQITPSQASQLRNAIGDRIEALTILGGDYGIAAANFRSTGRFSFGESTDATLAVTKLGGAGDIGDPQPLGSLPVGWQPRLQGNMGGLDGTQHLHSGLVEGDTTKIKAYGIEFGGGARFWANDRLSFAPTLVGLSGTCQRPIRRTVPSCAQIWTRLLGWDWSTGTWTHGRSSLA